MRKQGNDFIVETKETGGIIFKVRLASGVPADLTGVTAKFIVKANKETLDNDAVFTYTQSEFDGDKDTITIPLTQEFTNREPDRFYYSLFLIHVRGDGTQDLVYLQEGRFIFERGGSK